MKNFFAIGAERKRLSDDPEARWFVFHGYEVKGED